MPGKRFEHRIGRELSEGALPRPHRITRHPDTVIMGLRVAPEVVRSVWNEGPDDVELVIAAKKIDDPAGDAELVPDFWPA